VSIDTAEIYDPATDTLNIVTVSKQIPRMAHSSVTVADGRILITGGWDADTKATTATSLLINGLDGQDYPLPDLPFASHDAASVIFSDGKVLVAGGKTVVGGKEGATDMGAVMRF
jgi:hypothetical protein